MQRSRLWLALAAASMSLSVAAPAVLAQDEAEPAADEAKVLDQMTVLGSRRIGRSDIESPVPVDVITMQEIAERGAQFDLAQSLQFTVPSFFSTRQTGADGADLVDGAALRNLGSDQTLVLVNGKRRHTTSLVNLFGARNRGNTGTDLNTIPTLAIDRVEVLRDGAAAQYGSDAIAGVMNIMMKKDRGCEAIAGYGEYSKGDGENQLYSGYCGVEVGDGGIFSVTGEFLDRNRSDRSEPRGNPRTIGDSAVEQGTLNINSEIPLTDTADLYFTAGIQNRRASSGAFARDGVDDVPSRNSLAMYPDGFVPFINGDLEDRFATLGARGLVADWNADFSATYGYNELFYDITNTLNASIANFELLNQRPAVSNTAFDAGGFSFRQFTTNLDFSRYFDDLWGGTNVAFGGEYRDENYQIFAGEPGSYIDADGPGGGNAGSQGFPGFQPGDETDANRDNYAAYVDVEVTPTEQLIADFAVRFEDYSDFGSTVDGKIALAYKATEDFTVRGSVSSGFRAPSLQQRFFSSTFTDFISGEPVDVLLAPNGGEIARAAGIPDLTEEESMSGTLGFTWRASDSLSFTLDAYQIDIDDRIVLSGRFNTDDPNIGDILADLGVGEAQFFVNSIDTRTRGIDLTAAYDSTLWDGELTTYLGFNYGETDVTSIHAPPALVGREDVLLSERERLFIENGAPESKGVLGFDWTREQWNANVKLIWFGEQTLGTFSGPPVPNQQYNAKASADVSLTYSYSEATKFTLGAANVFDTKPTRQNPDETDNGHVYESVQFGLNGASWFFRVHSRFF
ncbi:MAG: TonB-dependent receptor [Rhodanobacteraceae bacterium]|nr:TonB-dependent receptor [Rhodanobacteraceae bacterium]